MKSTALAMLLVWLCVMGVLRGYCVMTDKVRDLESELVDLRAEKTKWEGERKMAGERGFWYVPGGICYGDRYVADMMYELHVSMRGTR